MTDIEEFCDEVADTVAKYSNGKRVPPRLGVVAQYFELARAMRADAMAFLDDQIIGWAQEREARRAEVALVIRDRIVRKEC